MYATLEMHYTCKKCHRDSRCMRQCCFIYTCKESMTIAAPFLVELTNAEQHYM